jgi:phosphate transport system substrate-binding protein
MKTLRSLVVLLATVSILAACSKKESETAGALKGTMRFLGSGTAASLVRPLADAYGKDHPDVKFEIEVSNSSFGLGQVRSGATDIAMSIKKLGPDDKDLKAYTIARDGLCMLVNRENAVEALTDDQINGIFKGEITNWKNVGGKDAKIENVNHAEVRTMLVLFVGYLGLQPSDMKYSDLVASTDADAINSVAGTPNAVTYTSIASALQGVAGGSPVKLVGLAGVAPTPENVGAGKVAVVYDVQLVTKGEPQEPIKSFLDFATSAKTAETVKSKSFAPAKS